MKVYSAESVDTTGVEHGKGTSIRWVVAREHGAPNFAMRVIEVQPGGFTPFHNHDEEHEVYLLEGKGELRGADGKTASPITAGDVALVLPQEKHQFVNTGDTAMKMICVVPILNKDSQ